MIRGKSGPSWFFDLPDHPTLNKESGHAEENESGDAGRGAGPLAWNHRCCPTLNAPGPSSGPPGPGPFEHQGDPRLSKADESGGGPGWRAPRPASRPSPPPLSNPRLGLKEAQILREWAVPWGRRREGHGFGYGAPGSQVRGVGSPSFGSVPFSSFSAGMDLSPGVRDVRPFRPPSRPAGADQRSGCGFPGRHPGCGPGGRIRLCPCRGGRP